MTPGDGDQGREQDGEYPGDAGSIRVRGARVHNLRDVDVDLPRDRLVVLTGVSGSGKSTLAFDTLYAEGRRRYIEGLSTDARQFLDQLERPDVDLIEGLPPTVAIDQRAGAANPRSTVATVTEIHDYLRVLYARAGLPHCPRCGAAIRRQTPEQIAAFVTALPAGTKLILHAPLVRGRKGEHKEAFEAIRRHQLLRARVDGQTVEIGEEPPKLAKTKTHNIDAVIDRLVVRDGIGPRLSESIDLALKLGEGKLVATLQTDSGWDDRLFSTTHACPACGVSFEKLEPRSFSFNSPHGACPTCDGLGSLHAFDADLVAPDRSKSIDGHALAPYATGKAKGPREPEGVSSFLAKHHLTRQAPLDAWPARTVELLMNGDPASGFLGVLPELEAEYRDVSPRRREALAGYRAEAPCPACLGARLRPEARAVTVGGLAIHEAAARPVVEAIAFFETLKFEPPMDLVGAPLTAEVVRRLRFLDRVGLGYLTLARGADTLSGGELQRVRLTTQIGSGLVGVCYVLDEPTAGLHPRDADRLLASLADLRDLGNSLVVVEHDEATIRAADWVIDLGPGAGPEGGRVVAQGPPDALVEVEPGASLTARYLAGPRAIKFGSTIPAAEPSHWITVFNAREHNLRGVNARFPVGALTCVSGVSGSGKSSLVLDVLGRAAARALNGSGPRPGAHDRVEGLDCVEKLVTIDQAPIGRNARSTPATYTGVFDEVRKVFALTREAKVRGFGASRFSFNAKGGRCEACQGLGARRIEMNFLPDLEVRCEACGGLRYNPPTLEARYKGRSIGDVLQMRVDAALAFFDAVPKVRRGLAALREAGLGYATLGQSSTTLSGGESQRVKLAAELSRAESGRALLILDEPTTGLHFDDVANLLRVLRRLADLGNTILVIEHNLEVIRAADWLIDLGPEGGAAGGEIVAEGTPAEVARSERGHTGRWLRET